MKNVAWIGKGEVFRRELKHRTITVLTTQQTQRIG